MSQRPNFLYIMTDQHRADWLGCYGHPVVKTPHVDAIANAGVRFDNFFVATPVCMPNRASFMTGRYPSVHGLRYNGCLLSERANTFVDVLREGGYHTASIGKSHLQPMTNMTPFATDDIETGPIAEAWKPDGGRYDHEQPDQYEADGRYVLPTPYYGFEHIDMVTGHGDQAGGHYRQWFRERHQNWQALTDRSRQLEHNYSCPQAFRTPIPEDSYPTSFIRDRACSYLESRCGESDPFFAFVSFPDPHHPFNPPGRYWDMYNPEDFDLRVRYQDHGNPPPPLQYQREQFETGGKPGIPQLAFMASDEHVREAMALTAGMISMIDDAVGEIIESLKSSGQYENTVIIFNSDHGDYLGDYNLLLKGAWPKDSVTRVPMLWSDPEQRSPSTSAALASTVDLAPTILERAGLKPYFGMQGKSQMGTVQGRDGPRDSVLIEYNDGGRRMGFESPARVRVAVTERWHLAIYKGEPWGELYDRKADTLQVNNLWDSETHQDVKADMLRILADQLIGQMDESPRSTRLA